MTIPALFGLSPWLTTDESSLLADTLAANFSAPLLPTEFVTASQTALTTDVMLVKLQAVNIGANTRYFGQTQGHYVERGSFGTLFNASGSPLAPPYLLADLPAPFSVASLLGQLQNTYGIKLLFSDVSYGLNDTIDPALNFPLQLQLSPSNIRLSDSYIPIYAAPSNAVPLIQVINPGRFLPGLRDLVIQPDVVVTSYSGLEYFGVDGTPDKAYLATLNANDVFSTEMDAWDFGNTYLIPYITSPNPGWVASTTPCFQNIYNAKVLYNGPVRMSDVLPSNPALTYNCLIQLDPAYSERAAGVIQIPYTPSTSLKAVLTNTTLDGLYVPTS